MTQSGREVRPAGGGPAKGPAAHGWEDQRWTPGRIKTVIGRRFHLTCTIQGVRKLLVRNGCSYQVPARRAIKWNDEAVAGWVKETCPCAEDSRRPVQPGSTSRTKPDSPCASAREDLVTTRPHPVVRARGRSRRRISTAALNCHKPLIYRSHHNGHKSFSWRDHRDLLIAAHKQLGGPRPLERPPHLLRRRSPETARPPASLLAQNSTSHALREVATPLLIPTS